MKTARVLVHSIDAGILIEHSNKKYQFIYHSDYQGPPVSLTMPLSMKIYDFDEFPSFFEGLLPEGILLEALLRKYKIDREDYFTQIIQVGEDLVGAVTVEKLP